MEIVYTEIELEAVSGIMKFASRVDTGTSSLEGAILYIDKVEFFILSNWRNIKSNKVPVCVLIDENALFSHLVSYCINSQIPVVSVCREEIEKYVNKNVEIDFLTCSISIVESSNANTWTTKTNTGNNRLTTKHGIQLLPTIQRVDNAERAQSLGIKSSGLIFTEYFYNDDECKDSPEGMFDQIADKFSDGISYFRLYDNDHDKKFIDLSNDTPAFLRGVRAYEIPEIREIVNNQISYLAKKSTQQGIAIVVPYVTNCCDMEFACELTANVYAECNINNILCPLIETPSAFFEADILLNYSDKILIGTNDLMASFFSYARNVTGKYRHYCDPYALSFWKFFITYPKEVIEKTTVCGQLVLAPRILNLLVSLGFKNFSIPTNAIPFMYKQLGNTVLLTYDEAVRLIKNSKAEDFKRSIASAFESQK